MAEDNPLSVFVAENQHVADAVVALLAEKGIATDVHVPPIDTTSEPLTGASEIVWKNTEFDVRVKDAAQLAEAKDLIASAVGEAAVRAVRDKRAARTGTVSATCDECGKPSDWPAAAMGTTELCPHCGAYMDVPDPDDDWSGIDFGAPEGDDEAKG